MRHPLWIPWRWWRRAAQFVLLIAFLWLFRRTEYTGHDVLPGGENFIFRLDPMAAAAAMLGARQVIVLFWPALLAVVLTLVLGRFFCGWICPLGTLLDYFHNVFVGIPCAIWRKIWGTAGKSKGTGSNAEATIAISPGSGRKGQGEVGLLSPQTAFGRNVKYFVLITVLLAAVFAYPVAGYVDPFSLLVRGMTFWGDAKLYNGADALFDRLPQEGWIFDVLRPLVKKYLLPFRPMVFQAAGASAALLALVFALEFLGRRFWCRYLCPTGTLFGLFSRRSLLKRVPAKVCKSCGDCTAVCRMGALDPTEGLSPQLCTLCMDCVDLCPKNIAKFKFVGIAAKARPVPTDLSRRGVLAGMAAGVAIPGAALAARLGVEKSVPSTLLRPPGADDEKTFLNLCIRCGECMKVCPTNVLQPSLFEGGLEGVFSPHLVPRYIFEQSFCEFSCTLCGQVCPTGAIPRLTEEEKHKVPTGKAYFDHKRCLPWAEGTPCIRCEEMCPTPEKAIKILNTFKIKGPNGEDVEIQQPYVDRDLCVGCGICESNCTIPGVAGIRVQRVESPDPGTEFLLNTKPADQPKPANPPQAVVVPGYGG